MIAATSPAAQLVDRFEVLIDAVHDYAIFMLETDGTVATWNRGAQRIKGYAAEEIIGQSFTVFYTPDDLANGKPARELLAAAASGQHHEEGWRVRKDSSIFWANVLITAINDADGRLIGYTKVTRDDTDRKIAEALIQQTYLMTERDRVACELQETVVRQIFRTGLQLSAIATLISDPQITSRVLSSIADLDSTLREIRNVITDQHPDRLARRPHTTVRLASRSHKFVGRRAGRFTASSCSGDCRLCLRHPPAQSGGVFVSHHTALAPLWPAMITVVTVPTDAPTTSTASTSDTHRGMEPVAGPTAPSTSLAEPFAAQSSMKNGTRM